MAREVGQPGEGCQPRSGHHFRAAPEWPPGYRSGMRPARRFIKTEIELPRSPAGRFAVIGGLVVGGTVAVMMVALFTAFLFETFRAAR